MATEPLPVTGAWQPGDPPGNRQFFTFASDHPFAVESGAVLRDVTVAYETWGTLNSDASNAVLIAFLVRLMFTGSWTERRTT